MDTELQGLFARIEGLEKRSNGGGHNDIDPTANVLSLVSAAMKRQDDLREADNKRSDDLRRTNDECNKEVSELKEKLQIAESRRIDAVGLAESRRIDARLAQQETAVSIASKESAATAAALRDTVETTRKALEATGAAATAATNAAIRVLEEKQYQAGGRDMQRVEGRQSNQWLMVFLVSLPSTVIAVIVLFKLFAK